MGIAMIYIVGEKNEKILKTLGKMTKTKPYDERHFRLSELTKKILS